MLGDACRAASLVRPAMQRFAQTPVRSVRAVLLDLENAFYRILVS
jgi:hypothetical protein